MRKKDSEKKIQNSVDEFNNKRAKRYKKSTKIYGKRARILWMSDKHFLVPQV